jgi:hypothetical protein
MCRYPAAFGAIARLPGLFLEKLYYRRGKKRGCVFFYQEVKKRPGTPGTPYK